MNRKLLVLSISAFLVFSSVTTMAAPFPDAVKDSNGIPTALESGGHPEQYEAVNQLLGTLTYTTNSGIDELFVEPEPTWRNLSGTIAVIGLSAGNTNTLGAYTNLDGSGKTAVTDGLSGFGFLGDGTSGKPYPAYTMSIPVNTSFGWYLQSNSAFYYSDATLNPDGWDHMMVFDMSALAGKTIYFSNISGAKSAYTFTNPYLLCWEDMNMGDMDYNDMMYLVDKVAPVPEPTTMLFLGLGLLGLVATRKKIEK